jgi:hypothetical protein
MENRSGSMEIDASQNPLKDNLGTSEGLFHPNIIEDRDKDDGSNLKDKDMKSEMGRRSTKIPDNSLLEKRSLSNKPEKPIRERRPALNPLITNQEENKQMGQGPNTPNTKRSTLVKKKTMLFIDKDPLEENGVKTITKKIKDTLKNYMESNIEMAIMLVVTLFCLFGPDLKVCVLKNTYDDIFNSFFILGLLLFLFEFLILIWVKNGYFMSFYFWLDFLAILSMVLEVNWFMDPIVESIVE